MNKCKGCQWYGKPYWSIINPCDNCPRDEIVEGNIIVFKEHIDRILDEVELTKRIEEKDKEIDRLNNIINGMEKVLNYDIDKSKEYMNKIINSGLEQGDCPIHYYKAEWQKEKAIGYLDKLKELREE